MASSKWRPVVAAVMLAGSTCAQAQVVAPLPRVADEQTGPLHLRDLLSSSARHAPQILEGLARVRAAEGKRLSVDGAFDTVFSAEAFTRPSGYYDGSFLDLKVTRPFETIGGQTYSGYRVSRGSFPIYEDKAYTNRLGEIRVGAVFSLLRDREIDERRFARTSADADVALADAERQMIAIGVQRRAIDAYSSWIAAGQRVGVYAELVKLAEERQAGLRRSVDAGLRPAIVLVENDQNLLRRRSLLVQAQQALTVAANSLSLYWRDHTGAGLMPTPVHLPSELPAVIPAKYSMADRFRPDQAAAELRERLVRERLTLDRNSLLPRLDMEVEASRNFGDEGLGGRSRFGNDVRFGLRLSVPLQQRGARGRIAQTEGEIAAARQRIRWLDDQISAEIRGLGVQARALERVVAIAVEEKSRADQMAVAERRRFTMGASDLFLVNTREEAAANAALSVIDVQLRRFAISADLAAATGDVDQLGLR
ncbi:TolC family protein [Novosphingobium sp. 9U]|uniref:TolC family protein n=1 Tax=Novosphingobium sp. 9U TaxID=2653158 RepID=UPI0012F34AAF|nr:TolC family protein [Novosphingobium sp. 9U]VWX48328.1 TolC family protein [Novosphingobium sp. 9U]